jgi:tRNA dimethylallyltransferase
VRELRAIASRPSPDAGQNGDEEAAADYTLGIYQSIGYREFDAYLSSPAPPEQDHAAFDAAADAMKLSTRQYAKRQVSWMRNKLLPAVGASNKAAGDAQQGVCAYVLDATGRHLCNRGRPRIDDDRIVRQNSENTGRRTCGTGLAIFSKVTSLSR